MLESSLLLFVALTTPAAPKAAPVNPPYEYQYVNCKVSETKQIVCDKILVVKK